MSHEAQDWAFDLLERAQLKLTSKAATVLLVLASHAGKRDRVSYPAVNRLMRMAKLSERTVQDAIKELIRSGAIVVERPGGGSGLTTRYRLIGNIELFKNPAAARGKSTWGTPQSAQQTPQLTRETPQSAHENPAPVTEEPVKEPVNEPVNEPSARDHCSLGAREAAAAALKPGERALEISDTRFEEFWSAYRRKAKKGSAEEAYLVAVAQLAALPHPQCGTVGQARAENFLIHALKRWTWPPDMDFAPFPANWLKDKRWDDRPAEPGYGSGIRSPL